jgi:hypothetical protein
MAINRNRELSQIASVVIVDDANKNVGIATTSAPKVGIGLTDPSYKLDVVGAINSNNDVSRRNSTCNRIRIKHGKYL